MGGGVKTEVYLEVFMFYCVTIKPLFNTLYLLSGNCYSYKHFLSQLSSPAKLVWGVQFLMVKLVCSQKIVKTTSQCYCGIGGGPPQPKSLTVISNFEWDWATGTNTIRTTQQLLSNIKKITISHNPNLFSRVLVPKLMGIAKIFAKSWGGHQPDPRPSVGLFIWTLPWGEEVGQFTSTALGGI